MISRALASTLRWEITDRSGMVSTGSSERIIIAIWHNRLAISIMAYNRYVKRDLPTRRMAALVSASRDGGLVAKVLENFEVTPIRGSSSRRAAPALKQLVGAAKAGYDIAITPDGPRGPCYHVQQGAIAVAQHSGLVIVPVGIGFSNKVRLKSWDQFQIPIPFSRCHVIFGEPIGVPKNLTEAEREYVRLQLEQKLLKQTLEGA